MKEEGRGPPGESSARPLEFRKAAAEQASACGFSSVAPTVDRLAEAPERMPAPNMPVYAPEGEEEQIAGLANAVQAPPDDRYIRETYQRLLALKGSCSTNSEIKEGISGILEDVARQEGNYTAMVDSLLMLHWTRKGEGQMVSYDEHMKEHVDTIKALVRSWMKDKHFGGQRKIKILDASCGTGRVLEAFLEVMPREVRSRVQIVANDVSTAALETARETLARFEKDKRVKVRYTQFDISQEMPPGKFDIVILSQTLPLICDEKALVDQRLGLSLPSESRHMTAKKKVLDALVRKVKPDRGEFLLIDEHPMRLSKTADDFESTLEDALFREIFRPVDKGTLINEIMKRMPDDVRFIGHVESFIDRQHSMYLMSYTKRGSQGERRDEREDERRIIRKMENIHPVLIDRLQQFDGNGSTHYRSINGDGPGPRLTINPEEYAEKIDGRPYYWHKNGSNNLVVISGLMHVLGKDEYRNLIEKLKRSRKAEPGAALLFIDNWPPRGQAPNMVGNGDARASVFNAFDDHVFVGSFRSGNKYGYLYVIRNL